MMLVVMKMMVMVVKVGTSSAIIEHYVPSNVSNVRWILLFNFHNNPSKSRFLCFHLAEKETEAQGGE